VLLAGEAGIGKSRLLAELRLRLAGEPHRWLEGRCASYGATTPFLPVIDALRRDAGIDDRDDERSASAKIDAAVMTLGDDLAWTLPFMKQLLSLPPDEAARARSTPAAAAAALPRPARLPARRRARAVGDRRRGSPLGDPASVEWLVPPTPSRRRARSSWSRIAPARPPFPTARISSTSALPPLSGDDMAVMTGDARRRGRARAVARADREQGGGQSVLRRGAGALAARGRVVARDGDTIALAWRLEDLTVPTRSRTS
jgi:hypothetical protein